MNKTIKALLIVLLSLIIAILIAILVFFIRGDFSANNFNGSQIKLVDSYEADLKTTNKINLNLKSADIEIKNAENEAITLKLYSNTESAFSVDDSEGMLSVIENSDSNKYFFVNVQKKIVVFVPEDYKGEYSLNTHSGDIVANNDLSNCIVNTSTHSGDITLNNARDISISTDSGDITISKISNKASISTSNGDIRIDEFILNEVSDITSSSGDITITTLDMINNLNITSSSGDVNIKNNKSPCYVETQTDSGDVDVDKSDRKSDVVLKIKTASGDIDVD